MNWEVFITCAVTGAGDTTGASDRVPVTPQADRRLRRSRPRAPAPRSCTSTSATRETGNGARDPALYREVVERIRAADVDVVLNLTAGMGGDLVLGGAEAPLPLDDAGTDMAGATERLAHVAELRPEICTLDCGTMNFAAGGDYVMVNTPAMLRAMARAGAGARRAARARGVRHRAPGVRQGADPRRADRRPGADPALHGHPLRRAGRPADAAGAGPPAAAGRGVLGVLDRPHAAAYVAMAALAGGNVRVGLEDNLYLSRGVLATNARARRARRARSSRR